MKITATEKKEINHLLGVVKEHSIFNTTLDEANGRLLHGKGHIISCYDGAGAVKFLRAFVHQVYISDQYANGEKFGIA